MTPPLLSLCLSLSLSLSPSTSIYFIIFFHHQLISHKTAQHLLASTYATGLLNGHDGLVPMDAGRSLFLDYMAALSGNAEANMAMGYRLVHFILLFVVKQT